MAYSPSEKYPGAVDTDPNYQGGKFRDNNPSTTNNGSPLKAIDRNELLARDEAIMNDAGFDYNGLPDTPQDSQLFKAYKASLGNGANLLSNHNFLIQTPDDSQPLPSSTPTSYPPGHQIFSGVFANETTGITNLTYIDGRVSFSGGDLYFAVPNAGAIARLDSSQLAASVADFDGKPRTRGVSFALVGDEYRVTVGIDALEDSGGNETLLGSVKFEQGNVATRHNVSTDKYSEGDIRRINALIDNGDDVTQEIIESINAFGEAWIPHSLDVEFSSTIILDSANLTIYGTLRQKHDGIGVWQRSNSCFKRGARGRFILDIDTFSDNSSMILLNKPDGDGGCVDNETLNMKLENIHTPNTYPSITPANKVMGIGLWMLAGSANYGLGNGDQYERVTKNNVDIKVRGFKNNVRMEARYLTAKGANGWVNSNTLKINCFEGERLLNIISDGHDAAGQLRGEVSGNFINAVLQDDAGRTTSRFIYCTGLANRIVAQFWDVDKSRYPIIEFAYGGSDSVAPSQNVIECSGDLNNKNNGSLSNGAYIEPVAGLNAIEFGKSAVQDFYPINLPPDSFGGRQKPSYFGVVENYFAFASHEKNEHFEHVKVYKVDNSGQTEITGSVGGLANAFNPENTDAAGIPLDVGTTEILIDIKMTEDINVSLAGITQAFGLSGLVGDIRMVYFNSGGSLISTQDGNMSNLSTWMTDVTNVQGVRSVRFTLDVDPSVKATLSISNIFCRTWDKPDDKYTVRRDRYNRQFGSIEFISGAEPIIEAANGNRYKITVDTSTGNVIAVQI